MSFDTASYIIGNEKGYSKGYDAGYEQGEEDATGIVVIEGGITCTDANNDGNVVITEG